MATIEARWDLKCIPRSIAVDLAPTVSIPSINSNSNNSQQRRSTNPFDEIQQEESTSWGSTSQKNKKGQGAKLQPLNFHAYTVLVGSDRGTIHLRTFSAEETNSYSSSSSSSTTSLIYPLGYDKNVGLVHPLHKPMDTSIHPNASIVACILAENHSSLRTILEDTRKISNSSTASKSSATENMSNATSHHYNPVCLCLQADKTSNLSSSSATNSNIAFASTILAIHPLTNSTSNLVQDLPHMTCATYHPKTGYIYAIDKSILSLPPKAVRAISKQISPVKTPTIYFNAIGILPASARSGNQSIQCVCDGHVVVIAVGNAFYAVSGARVPHGLYVDPYKSSSGAEEDFFHDPSMKRKAQPEKDSFKHPAEEIEEDEDEEKEERMNMNGHHLQKVISFRQGSQVHPAIVVEIPMHNDNDINQGKGAEKDVRISLLFLASGRECAAVEILYNPKLYSNVSYQKPAVSPEHVQDQVDLPLSSNSSGGSIVVGKPRHDVVTVASPILAALAVKATSAKSGPMIAILTTDGLVHTRSASCMGIPLFTLEVGTRPNDFFSLLHLPDNRILAASYGGEGRLLSFQNETLSDLADRVMKLSIDAFGSGGFPRIELAEAIGATFSATSYVGPEPTNSAKTMLKQYLEFILGLDNSGSSGDSDRSCWFFLEQTPGASRTVLDSKNISAYLSFSAIQSLNCAKLSPPNAVLANRCAKVCATKIGIISKSKQNNFNINVLRLCKTISDILLLQAQADDSSTVQKVRKGINMDLVETASWLMRACGEHEKSIDILQVRMNDPNIRNKTFVSENVGDAPSRLGWSQLKYESFIASYLQDLWKSGIEENISLVLHAESTRRLLESNPSLGLEVLTVDHPRTKEQWMKVNNTETPADTIMRTVSLLKEIRPQVSNKQSSDNVIPMANSDGLDDDRLPLDSGRSLAVNYLESAIGLNSFRPPIVNANYEIRENVQNIHNELALLLLEGVLSDRTDIDVDNDSPLGSMYRSKLRRLLGWHNSLVSPEIIMSALPTSFLRERALLLGKLGKHEDAIKILYCNLKSIDLALEYCDARYEKQEAERVHSKKTSAGWKVEHENSCAYLPLIRVALDSCQDTDSGVKAAIKIMGLRRKNIDRAAAILLLPSTVPVSLISKSFLIPAIVDSESEARRLMIASALLRTKYVRLKHALTDAQIKAQSNLLKIPSLQALGLGDLILSSKPMKVRSAASSSSFRDFTIIKYFFSRYVVIQAVISNSVSANGNRSLTDVQFFVAESSDEALIPCVNVPIKTLPPNTTGSAWCALAASPQRLEGTAILTCEIRYRVLDFDSATGAPLSFDSKSFSSNTSVQYVEETQEIEIRALDFE